MSTFIRGVNLSTKWLKVVILAVMVVVCATAITLGVIFSQKQNFVVQPENNNKTDVLDNNALFSANGVDEDIATRLAQNVSLYGDNVALGNAGGSIVSSVIKLGGINWTVVYKQNDILTLYANDSVAEMSFGGNSYSQSEVRDYLLNTFYPQFLQKVGYADLDSLIVPYGDNRLYYQAKGAQAVILNTLNNGVISNNDGINGDKIWIPSAYEVGGFANTEYSPRARVNSFKTINANGFTVNSGLWNTSNEMRLNADNMWLRSNVDNSIASIANGVVIKGQNSGVKLKVHPCINIYMPSVCKNEVMQASANDYSSSNAVLTASSVDYSSSINSSEGTSHTGTSSDKFTISKPETLCILSSAVMSGQDFSGKYFVLTKDIDMLTATSSSDSITVWSPIGREGFPFKGNFSGNGFTISNLASAGSGLAGLFGYVDSATIEKLGILNSTWYTTNDYIGGVVCQANNSSISQCYSDSGVSGKQYVGGIVGQISASSANGVQDCYNLHAVTGSQYVGGIVGNISSSLIKNCYNTGSVGSTLSTNYGGIAGGNTSGTVTNCYYYNSTGNSIGTAISSYDAVRTASTFSGFTFKNGSTSGTWFMSNVLNDRMPMLYIFMKNPTVNVRVVKGGTATVNNASTVTTTVGSKVNLAATPDADATNHYYRFAGWYFYDVDLSGNMMTTDRKYSDTASISSFTVDDYYNLEARFVRIYSVTIDNVTNGFSSGHAHPNFEYTPTNATSSVSGNWYDEGTEIKIELGNNAQYQLASLKGGTKQTELTTDIAYSGTTATFTAGVTNTADQYFIRATYDRVYEIKTSVIVPSKFTGKTPPTSTLSFKEAGTGTSTEITSASTDTKKIVYNSPITPTASTVAGLNFKSYTLKVGTTDSSVDVPNELVFYISTAMSTDALRPADSVTTLEFVATYTMTQITIKANTPSNGKVIISTTKDQQTSLTESSANALTITVDYGDAYYIYAVPLYSSGYGIKSMQDTTTTDASKDVAYEIEGTNGVVYSTASLTATAPTTYTVTFALRNAYTINFAVSEEMKDKVTLSNASVSGLNFASSVSSYTVKINTEELAKQYFFDNVTIKIGTSTKTFTTGHTSGTYEIITDAQAIFGKMSGDKTVKGIYALSPATTAGYSNTTIEVTLNFITITRTITVQSWVSTNGGTSDADYTQDDSTLEQYYTINESGKAGSYALNSSVTVTANTSSSANGYKVSKIVLVNADGTSKTVTPTSTAYGNSAEMTFTLNENKTIKIYYIMHRYQVTIADNLNGTKDSAVAGTSVKSLGLTNEQASNTYTYKIGTADKESYDSAFYVLYGNALTIEANATQFDYKDGIERKAMLDSIIVKTGSNEVEYSPAKSTTLLEAVTQGNYDTITIVYKFILLQALNISFTDTVTGNESSALLVILVNKNDSSDTFVMILPKGSNQPIECQATDYTISAILPIFVKATTSVSGSTLEGSTLTVVNGSATTVTINVSEIIKGSASVYGSAIF